MKPCHYILFLLLAIHTGFVCSCGSSPSQARHSEKEHNEIEQQLSKIMTPDSLDEIIKAYHDDKDVTGEIIALRIKGKLLRKQNDFKHAIICHTKSEKLAEECGDTLEWVQALNNLGTDYRRIGSLNEAAECHMSALLLTMKTKWQESQTAQKNRVVSLNGLGNLYMSLGSYELADSVLREALKGETALGSDLGQAINYANLGTIKEEQGDIDSAWCYYRMSLEKNMECKSQLGVALCYNHFGRLYELSDMPDHALDEYEKAYNTLKDGVDEWHTLEAILNIAHAYIKKKDYTTAIQKLDIAMEMANKIGSMEHQSKTHKLYYYLYDQKGDTRKALDHHLRAEELEDSLFDTKTIMLIQDTRLALERELNESEREKAMDDLTKERYKSHLMLMGALIIILLALVFIGFLCYSLHIRGIRQRISKKTQKEQEAFFTNITHEFRTPLTVILGLGQQLEDEEIANMSQVRSAARMIVRQGNSLLGLINQLLDIAKMRSAVGEAKWRHGNVIAFVAMAIENYLPYADQKNIDLTYTHSLTSIEMDFVPDYLEKMLSNLVSNSLKFTPEFGKINVTVEETSNNQLKLQVFDTGKGIPAESLPHVFDAFYQAKNTPSDIGTGIGLSIVKLMTEAVGGTVEVESIEGKGTTFTILIPIVRHEGILPWTEVELPKTQTPYDPAQKTEPMTENDEQQQSAQALIIEDNHDIALYIGKHLEKEFNITYARTAAEGLKKAKEIVPDLIITDVMMPGDINGLELCQKVRSDELLCHIPIIIITAMTTEDDRIKGLQAGADAYLVKPFNSEELLVRVHKLLERQRRMREHFSLMQPDASLGNRQMKQEDLRFLGRVADTVYRMMTQGKTDVETLASELALSRSALNRKLLSITGQNTQNYMMRLRLAHAKRLLKSDQLLAVGDVATKCGFDDLAYFSRIFKQNFGMTPSQYRKLN